MAAMGLLSIVMFAGITALGADREGALRREHLRPGRLPGQLLDRRPAHRGRPAGGGRVRRHALGDVLLHPGGHRAHPDPRGQHRVQRVPVARFDPGRAPVPAPAAAHPGRPARLLQRHHPARPDRGRPDRRVRRLGDPADPALHPGRLHVVHAVAGRHGASTGTGLLRVERDPAGPRPDAALPGHQRGRRGPDRTRAGGRAGHQVHPRRVPGRHRGSVAVPDDARDPSALRPGLRRARPGPGRHGAAAPHPRRGARVPAAQADRCGRWPTRRRPAPTRSPR